MYVFDFKVGMSGWPIEYVTEERRHNLVGNAAGFLRDGQIFTIVIVDDPGPFDFPFVKVQDVDGIIRHSDGSDYKQVKPKRWHVALLGDRLFWLNHELLVHSNPIAGE
jgi:hypothetical protein